MRDTAAGSESAKADNVDALRARIDRGETHDKVAAEDPAASPLGTDAEAAGVSPDTTRKRARSSGLRPEAVARSADIKQETWMSPKRLLAIVAVIAAVGILVALLQA